MSLSLFSSLPRTVLAQLRAFSKFPTVGHGLRRPRQLTAFSFRPSLLSGMKSDLGRQPGGVPDRFLPGFRFMVSSMWVVWNQDPFFV